MQEAKDKKSSLISAEDFVRIANNFYTSKGIDVPIERLVLDSEFSEYLYSHREDSKKKFKVAFVWICLNPPYWQYAKDMIEGAKRFFLPGHTVDYFVWSDMPKEINYGATVFPTEPVEWPLPTLMRYHLFLQQEEILKEYDYIFYCDVDMKFVNIVGDEILGEGWTAAQHPMYAVRKEYNPPYEPNPNSAVYIPRPGRILIEDNKPRFQPLYFAGGFQGAPAKLFLEGCKVMKKMIDKDLGMNYISIWNDEGAFNRYMFDNPPTIVLNPSYVYPDSLHKEYYIPLWGRDYQPKLMTLTKKFTMSKEGGEAVKKMIESNKLQ
jgi:histo-blood group ABO system transferase